MKSSKMLLLLIVAVASVTMNIVADENVPTPIVIDGAIDLKQYLFGGVDSNGQTLLYVIASECDKDKLDVHFDLFDLLENGVEKPELLKAKIEQLTTIIPLSPELFKLVMVRDVNKFICVKDNNGHTALDIAKKRNELNPHERCSACISLLALGDMFTKPAQPEIDKIVNILNK